MKNSSPKVKNLSDSDLVAVIRMKNRELYQEIVSRYQSKLFVYVYRMLGNKEETEDILQNVFVKTYRNLKSFDTAKKFSSWIYRIAHNETVNYLRRRSKKRFISIEDLVRGEGSMGIGSQGKSPVEDWMTKETGSRIDEALLLLPKHYREVLVLRYFSDKSYDEIAKIIKKPVNTVGTLINRAKKKLLAAIKP